MSRKKIKLKNHLKLFKKAQKLLRQIQLNLSMLKKKNKKQLNQFLKK